MTTPEDQQPKRDPIRDMLNQPPRKIDLKDLLDSRRTDKPKPEPKPEQQ